MGTTSDPVDEKTWLVPVDFCPLRVGCFTLVDHLSVLRYFIFIFPAFSCKGRFFLSLVLRCGTLSVFDLFACIENLSLYLS